MIVSLLLALSLLTIHGPASPDVDAASGPYILVGRFRYIQQKTRSEFESERSQYVHENLQFVVVEVNRIVVGPSLGPTVIIGIRVDDRGAPHVDWFTGSYGVLDPDVWKEGSRTVVFARPSRQAAACEPTGWGDEDTFMDGYLNSYRNSPVLCASINDVLLIREE